MQYSTYLVRQRGTTIGAWGGIVLNSIRELVYRRNIWIGFHLPKKPNFPRRFEPGSYILSGNVYKNQLLKVGANYSYPVLRQIQFSELPADVRNYIHVVTELQTQAWDITQAQMVSHSIRPIPKIAERIAILDLLGPREEYYQKGLEWNCFEQA